MLLVVDVGNTNVVLGIYDGPALKAHWRLATDAKTTADEYGILFTSLLASAGIVPAQISGAIMPTFFVGSEAIVPPTIRITGPLLRHLRQSLRLQTGEQLTVTDDRGTRYRAEISEITSAALIGRILDTIPAPPKTARSIVLAQSLLKGEKMDWVIQKATELGVDRIVPILAAHSVVRPRTDRIEHQLARWQRIAHV